MNYTSNRFQSRNSERKTSYYTRNAKLSEANADLEKKQHQLEKEIADLRKHLDDPEPEPEKPQTCQNTGNARIMQETSFEEPRSMGPLLVNLPTENRVSALQEPAEPANTNDNFEQSPPNAANTNTTHVIFLCDSNGKY